MASKVSAKAIDSISSACGFGGFFFTNVLHQSRSNVADSYFVKQNMHWHPGRPRNRGRNNCIYPLDRQAAMAGKKRLLADHLVDDPDAFAKKKSMSLRSSCYAMCFAMRKKGRGRVGERSCRGRNSDDKLVTWWSDPTVFQESRPQPARSWLGTKYLHCRIMTS